MVKYSTAYLDIPKEEAANIICNNTRASSEYDPEQDCIIILSSMRERGEVAKLYDYPEGTEMRYETTVGVWGGEKCLSAVEKHVIG